MRRRLRSATFPLHRHSLWQLAVDAGLVALAYYLAFVLRLNSLSGFHNGKYGVLFNRTLPWVVIGTAVLLTLGRVYQRRWRYATQRDIENLLQVLVVDTIVLVAAIALFRPYGGLKLPDGTIALYFLLSLLFLGSVRLGARSLHDRRLRGFRSRKGARDVLIVGAGDGGRLVLRELLRNAELGLNPVGFVDDDPLKRRLRLDGVRVRGTTRDLPRILDDAEPDEVIIAIPSARCGCASCGPAGSGASPSARYRRCSSYCAARSTSPSRCAMCASRMSSVVSRCTWSSSASAPICGVRSCS